MEESDIFDLAQSKRDLMIIFKNLVRIILVLKYC